MDPLIHPNSWLFILAIAVQMVSEGAFSLFSEFTLNAV